MYARYILCPVVLPSWSPFGTRLMRLTRPHGHPCLLHEKRERQSWDILGTIKNREYKEIYRAVVARVWQLEYGAERLLRRVVDLFGLSCLACQASEGRKTIPIITFQRLFIIKHRSVDLLAVEFLLCRYRIKVGRNDLHEYACLPITYMAARGSRPTRPTTTSLQRSISMLT